MVSKQKALKPVSEQAETKQVTQSGSSDDDVNWSSGYETDNESDWDMVFSD